MSLPASNARLTMILGGGFSEDYDEPATNGTPKWTGDADAYVVDKVRTAVTAAGLARVKTTYVVIPVDLADGIESGDTVTYTINGTSVSRVVWEIEAHEIAGTARLHFKDTEEA